MSLLPRYEVSLSIKRGKSKRIFLTMVYISLCACIAIVSLILYGYWLFILLMPLLVLLAVSETRTHALLNTDRAVLSMCLYSSNEWTITRNKTENIPVSLSSTSFVTPYLMVLNFMEPQRRTTTPVIVMPDSISRNEYRKLLVRLRTTQVDRKTDWR